MENEILEMYYKKLNYLKELVEELKVKYDAENPFVAQVYEELLNGTLSPLSLSIPESVETELSKLDELYLIVYNYIYNILDKENLNHNKDINVYKDSKGFKIETKEIEGLTLPIFKLIGSNADQNVKLAFYQTEFNREKRLDYQEDLNNYYLKLIYDNSDTEGCLKKLDELNSRLSISRAGEIELMSIQIGYGNRIFNSLGINPREYFTGLVPHVYQDGKTLVRNRMKTKLKDTYQIY